MRLALILRRVLYHKHAAVNGEVVLPADISMVTVNLHGHIPDLYIRGYAEQVGEEYTLKFCDAQNG